MSDRPHNFHMQSSAADCGTGRHAFDRFKALEADLAVIGAKPHVVGVTHDDVHIEIDCPIGREAEARALLDKHFPR